MRPPDTEGRARAPTRNRSETKSFTCESSSTKCAAPPIDKRLQSDYASETRCWLFRGALEEFGDLLASLGVSIAEAAWRGHDAATLVHVRQARLTILEAISAAKQLTLSADGGDR